MKTKNKQKSWQYLILKSMLKLLKSDRALALSLLFSFGLGFLILYFSKSLIMDIKQALFFMFGTSLIFLTLNFILNNTKNYQNIIKKIEEISKKILHIEKKRKRKKESISLSNAIFIIFFSLVITFINYLAFSETGKEILASFFHPKNQSYVQNFS